MVSSILEKFLFPIVCFLLLSSQKVISWLLRIFFVDFIHLILTLFLILTQIMIYVKFDPKEILLHFPFQVFFLVLLKHVIFWLS